MRYGKWRRMIQLDEPAVNRRPLTFPVRFSVTKVNRGFAPKSMIAASGSSKYSIEAGNCGGLDGRSILHEDIFESKS